MKKLGIFLVFIFALGTFCFGQSGNDAQWIVGTWIGLVHNGEETVTVTLTFGSNGIATTQRSNDAEFDIPLQRYEYFLSTESGSNVIVYMTADGRVSKWPYNVSPDKKTLIRDINVMSLDYIVYEAKNYTVRFTKQ